MRTESLDGTRMCKGKQEAPGSITGDKATSLYACLLCNKASGEMEDNRDLEALTAEAQLCFA